MSPTIQADTPYLTLVSSTEPAPRQPSESVDPLRFVQAMAASIDLDQVLGTLSAFISDLVGQSGWEYRHPGLDQSLAGGQPDRHRIEYALTFNGEEMGSLALMRGRRFSDQEQAGIEGLLGLGATAIHNALRFLAVTRQLERDPLTGLGNRRAFSLQGAQWLSDCVRHKKPLSLMVMDLDRFKAVNDKHGHPVGDRLLCAVAQVVQSLTRAGDLCIRMGGDELAVLLPGTDLAAAMECAERIRRAISKHVLVDDGSGGTVSVTASVGVAAHRQGMDLDQLYRRADEALYAAKHAGSNRVLACAGVASSEPDHI